MLRTVLRGRPSIGIYERSVKPHGYVMDYSSALRTELASSNNLEDSPLFASPYLKTECAGRTVLEQTFRGSFSNTWVCMRPSPPGQVRNRISECERATPERRRCTEETSCRSLLCKPEPPSETWGIEHCRDGCANPHPSVGSPPGEWHSFQSSLSLAVSAMAANRHSTFPGSQIPGSPQACIA